MDRFQDLLHFFVRRATSHTMRLSQAGSLVLVAAVSGLGLRWLPDELSITSGEFSLQVGMLPDMPMWVSGVLLAVGVLLHAAALVARHAKRRKVICLQVSGLRSLPRRSISQDASWRLIGWRDRWHIDLRDHLVDGKLHQPELVVHRIAHVQQSLRERAEGFESGDVDLVVGGLAPVPLLMLLGYQLDDEFPLHIMDWDRSKERWFEPRRGGDALAIATEGLDEIEEGTREAAVSLSVSYGIRPEDVARQIGDLPHVRIHMPHTSAKWRDQQEQIAQTWFDALKALQARGVDRVHLFVAVPASLAIQLGRRYDRRNLPSARVYQYDRDTALPYPLSLELPRPGEAPIVHHHSGGG